MICAAYHSANVVKADGDDCMIVWGGLHNEQPVGRLEVYNFKKDLWRFGKSSYYQTVASEKVTLSYATKCYFPLVEQARGVAPACRFGHSCTSIGPALSEPDVTDRLVVVGGSNGNDLIRNGDEFRDVCVYTRVCVLHTSVFKTLSFINDYAGAYLSDIYRKWSNYLHVVKSSAAICLALGYCAWSVSLCCLHWKCCHVLRRWSVKFQRILSHRL